MGRFSEILMENFQEPRNFGRIEGADRRGQAGFAGGAGLTIYLQLTEDRVRDSRFETFGCGVTIACGSMLTQMIEGRSLDECLSLTPDDLIAALEGIPPDKRHCPIVAVDALRIAIRGADLPKDSQA